MFLIPCIGGRCCSVHLSVLLSSLSRLHRSVSPCTCTHFCLFLLLPPYILSNSFIPSSLTVRCAPLCCTASPSLVPCLILFSSRSVSSTCRHRGRGEMDEVLAMWGSPQLAGVRQGWWRERTKRRRSRGILQWSTRFYLFPPVEFYPSPPHCSRLPFFFMHSSSLTVKPWRRLLLVAKGEPTSGSRGNQALFLFGR